MHEGETRKIEPNSNAEQKKAALLNSDKEAAAEIEPGIFQDWPDYEIPTTNEVVQLIENENTPEGSKILVDFLHYDLPQIHKDDQIEIMKYFYSKFKYKTSDDAAENLKNEKSKIQDMLDFIAEVNRRREMRIERRPGMTLESRAQLSANVLPEIGDWDKMMSYWHSYSLAPEEREQTTKRINFFDLMKQDGEMQKEIMDDVILAVIQKKDIKPLKETKKAA